MSDVKLEQWPVSKLEPLSKINPRVHPREQVDALVESINEFGFLAPIIVDPKRGIRAGHGRFEAAKRLKLKSVPVIVAKNLSDEAKAAAYMLADNKLAQGSSWDSKKLSKVLSQLQKDGYNVAVTGFSDDDMRRIEDDLAASVMRSVSTKKPGGPGKERDDDEDREDADDAPEPENLTVTMSFVVTPEEREEVLGVLNQIREGLGKTLSQALVHVVRGWSKTNRSKKR